MIGKKSIKLSDYFELRKNEYITVQLVPSKSCKNQSTGSIATLINKIFVQATKLVRIENKRLILTHYQKVSYYIDITKEDVQFFFIIPKVHMTKFRAKFSEIWKNIEIREVEPILQDINNYTRYQLRYRNHEALSLETDKRNNDLLHANLSVIDIIEKGESVGILYNFIPTGPKESLFFQKIYSEGIKKYTDGNSVQKVKNITDIVTDTIKFLIQYIDDFLKYTNKDAKKEPLFLTLKKEISESTKKKGKTELCKSQIVIISKAKTKEREKEIAIAMCNSFKSINDDNELVQKEIKRNDLDTYKTQLFGAEVNRTSVSECQNFLSLPGQNLLNQYKNIEYNKILERKVPECLENGEIRIGTVKYKENTQQAYYSMDEQISRLGRVILGSMGSGKSYYLTNLAKDIIKADRGLIVIDYIDKCQLADSIKAITPKERLLEIDCASENQLQSFAFNELKITSDMTTREKVAIAMQKAQQFQVLLDAINTSSELTPRMLRYLYAASTIVFVVKEDASLNEIIDVLESPVIRKSVIDMLNTELKEKLVSEIKDLKALDKETKSGIVENHDVKIDGIIDRISWLKTNLYTKEAFGKKASRNISFVDAINQKKVVLIKIREKDFQSKMLRNVIATFYLSKIWLAKQLGATETKTELFFDEIHQSYNCQLLLEDILVEHRKFNLIPTLAMHYLDQCTAKCKNSILASGSSFLLLSGCDVKAFDELKAKFEKNGYSEIDLVELERYHALCLIKNEKENYSSFVAKLPS